MGHADLPVRGLTVLNQLGAGAVPPVPGVRVIDDEHTAAWRRCADAEVLLTAPRNGWREAPHAAPPGWPGRLRWVHLASSGIDFFPRWLFDGPMVTTSRGVAADAIADFVLAAVLEHAREPQARRVHGLAQWRDEFARANRQPAGLLREQTLGIAGYGAIGQAVARRALAFGVRVLTWCRRRRDAGDGTLPAPALATLLAQSHHLVLALPITPQTRGIIDAALLAHARPGLHLINVARGALIDHDALRQALDDGRLAAATLDVTDPEPPPEGHWLYTHPRVRLTPHVSWAAGDTQRATVLKFQDNLSRYLTAQPLADVVDVARGY